MYDINTEKFVLERERERKRERERLVSN